MGSAVKYEVQLQSCQPGQSVQFTFQNQIQSFVVGLQGFTLSYGTTNYWIETLSISLPSTTFTKPGPPGAADTYVVEVRPAVTMADHSGHSIDAGDSFVWVACVAMTGADDSSTLLTNLTGIANNASQIPQGLPGTGQGFTVSEVCLSGFDLSYDTADHRYQGAKAIAGITSQGAVNSLANLWDASGHNAATASIDAGILVSTDSKPPFVVKPVTYTQYSPRPFPCQFSSSLAGAVALIQGFNIQYASGDHGVSLLWVGTGSVTINGDTVLLNPWAFTNDGEHTSDPTQSYVNLLVVAIPSSAA